MFEYVAMPRVSKVVPSAGPLRGGSVVVIHGEDLPTDGDVMCSLGGRVADGESVTSSTMRCLAPEADAAGLYTVEVSGNGADFSRDGVKYLVQESPEITALRPSVGPEAGGTAITVEGSGFGESSGLFCRFGQMHSDASAQWLGAGRVRCLAPSNAVGRRCRVPR